MVNTYRTAIDGSGRLRCFINGAECADVNDYCARYFADLGVMPTDANVAATEATVESSSEVSTEPDAFAAITASGDIS